MPDPHLPDEAVYHALARLDAWLSLLRTEHTHDEIQDASHAFFRSLGLDGVYDRRVINLCETVLAHFRLVDRSELPADDVHTAIVGVSLGLLLAEGTGWEPPIPDGDSRAT